MDFLNPFSTRRSTKPGNHPAFQLGQRVQIWLDRQSIHLANFLNTGQHRVGFRIRNWTLGGLGVALLLYFLTDLLTCCF